MQIDAAERERRRTLLAEHYDAENEHDLKRIMATFSPGAEMRYNGRSFADPEAIQWAHGYIGLSAAPGANSIQGLSRIVTCPSASAFWSRG